MKTTTAAFLLLSALTTLAACKDDDGDAPKRGATNDPSTGDRTLDAGLADGGTTPSTGSGNDADAGGDRTPPRTSGDAGSQPPLSASDMKLYDDVVAKLVSCELYDDPKAALSHERLEDDFDRCLYRCALAGDCDGIVGAVCGTDDSSVGRCWEQCSESPKDGFACGDGSRVPHVYKCDGEDDCPGGEDEQGTCLYRCTDGTSVPLEQLCDDTPDCRDGSDENDCLACADKSLHKSNRRRVTSR